MVWSLLCIACAVWAGYWLWKLLVLIVNEANVSLAVVVLPPVYPCVLKIGSDDVLFRGSI